MSVFLYAKKGTFLHRLDPRAKIVLLAVLFVIAALADDWIHLLLLFTVIAALFLAARSAGNMGRMAGLFGIIGVTTFGLWMLFYRGPAGGAVAYAAAMSLRFVDLLCAGLLFLSITSLEEISGGLMLLGVPYPVAFALSLSFRLVVVFISTGFTIVEAQKVRGNDVREGPLVKRIASYIPLLAPLILTGIKRAQTLTLTLESKGFSPRNTVSTKGRYRMRPADWAAAAVGVTAAGMAIGLKMRGML